MLQCIASAASAAEQTASRLQTWRRAHYLGAAGSMDESDDTANNDYHRQPGASPHLAPAPNV